MGKVRYLAAGDSSVSVEFGNEISPEINRQIRAFKIAVEKSGIPGIVETVPTYRSLLVNYKPEVIRFQDLTKEFEGLLGSLGSIVIPPPEVIEIPVLYGGEMGPDIENVAKHNNKTVEEVIKIHTSEEYLTPLKLYDAEREEPILLSAGQYIKFRSVTEKEYREIEKQVADNTYKYVKYAKEV